MNDFIKHMRQAQAMQKKMEREGIFGVMNDPVLRKQMEDLQKRFGGPKKMNQKPKILI
jgi:ribosomal protein S2